MEGNDRGPTTDERPGRVLVVAPEPGLAELYALWLSEFYDAATAYSAIQAIDVLEPSFDVVLLDASIQGVGSEGLLERIRDREFDVRIAVVSGEEPPGDVGEMVADEYVSKPVDSERIEAAVEALLLRPKRSGTGQELLSLVSRKRTLEARAESDDLAGRPEYRRLLDRIEDLTGGAEIPVQHISSKFRPDACPQCDLRWDISVAGAVGFHNLGSDVWKCSRCGHVVHYPDPAWIGVVAGLRVGAGGGPSGRGQEQAGSCRLTITSAPIASPVISARRVRTSTSRGADQRRHPRSPICGLCQTGCGRNGVDDWSGRLYI